MILKIFCSLSQWGGCPPFAGPAPPPTLLPVPYFFPPPRNKVIGGSSPPLDLLRKVPPHSEFSRFLIDSLFGRTETCFLSETVIYSLPPLRPPESIPTISFLKSIVRMALRMGLQSQPTPPQCLPPFSPTPPIRFMEYTLFVGWGGSFFSLLGTGHYCLPPPLLQYLFCESPIV